jgi:hypothetical protein
MRRVLVAALLTGAAVAGVQGTVGADSLPACKYEDGSGQRACVWDGRHMGNGAGRSYVIRFGNVTYVSHRRAHHLAYAH